MVKMGWLSWGSPQIDCSLLQRNGLHSVIKASRMERLMDRDSKFLAGESDFSKYFEPQQAIVKFMSDPLWKQINSCTEKAGKIGKVEKIPTEDPKEIQKLINQNNDQLNAEVESAVNQIYKQIGINNNIVRHLRGPERKVKQKKRNPKAS